MRVSDTLALVLSLIIMVWRRWNMRRSRRAVMTGEEMLIAPCIDRLDRCSRVRITIAPDRKEAHQAMRRGT
jgi:hypothetical protein